MSRPRKLAPDAVPSGEGWPPPMSPDERATAEAALGASIPDKAWARVETARAAFIATRRREAGGLGFAVLKARLEEKRAGWAALLDSLRVADEIDVAVWARLQMPLDFPLRHVYNALLEADGEVEIGQPIAGPVLESLFVVVTALKERADAELRILATEEKSWGDADRAAAEARDDARAMGKFRFVDGLIAMLAHAAVAAGMTPTAAKSSRARNPKPSPFVAFVRAIFAAIPEADRPALQSDSALAAQCAVSLRLWKNGKVLRES